MSKVAIITEQQASELVLVEYTGGCLFNPIQDSNDNWVVSEEEINQSDLNWLKQLPLINYSPKIKVK